jgi:hypothetical protein
MNLRPVPTLVLSPNGFGFRADTGEVFRLNPTACEVIGWMRRGEDETALVRHLSEQFTVPVGRARSDLSAFLEHLQTLHLLDSDES